MNRKMRKKFEKKLGYLKQFKESSTKRKHEIRKRKIEIGKKLHLQHLENVKNMQRKMEEEQEAKIFASLIESGKTEQEAKEFIEYNKNILLKRKEKLRLRKKKQEEKYGKKQNNKD